MNTSARMLPARGVRLCLGLGAFGWVAMAVGWYQAAGRVRVEGQVSWSVLSVAGTTAVGLVTVLLVLAGRRAVEQRLRGVLAGVAQDRRPMPARAVLVEAGALVATDRMARYHRPSCRLAQGKPIRPAERAAHEAAGRRPCGVCLRGTPPDPRGRP